MARRKNNEGALKIDDLSNFILNGREDANEVEEEEK